MDRRQIEQLHEQASEFYVRGEFLEAVATWKQILEIDPDDEKAQEGLRISSNLQASATLPPPDGFLGQDEPDRLKACLSEVEVRIDSGDLHGAMRAAELLRVEHPDDPSVLSVLAKAYSLAGESDKAAEMMAKFLASSPEYAAAAALLEECRQVSPHESHLGSVVVRDGDSGPAADPLLHSAPAGLLLEEPAPDLDDEPVAVAAAPRASAVAATVGEEKGLALPDATSFRQAESKDAPAAALRDRVSELLRQARAAMADGRHDDALGFVSRILILDDGNDEAMRLEEEIRKHSGAAERDLDRLITEGAHLFDLGRHDESRQIFLQVLEKSPSHREAVAYLERVDAQMARAGGPAILPAGVRPRGKVWAPPAEDGAEAHKPEAAPLEANEDLLAPMESDQEPEVEGTPLPEAEVAVAPRTPFSARRIPDLVGPRFFRLVVIGLAGILVAVVASWWLLRDSGGSADADSAANVPAQHGKGKKRAAAAVTKSPAILTPEQKTAQIAQFLAQGDEALARRDYQAAIMAYNEVVRLDPEEGTVRAKLLAAGEEYKKNRSELEQLEKARTLFAGGEYESSLRMIYRLPEGLLPADVWERYKVAGWYNMGVVALRGANCKDAVAHLTEAQSLAPNDADVRAARDLADRCASMSSDRSFYNRADGLAFRKLEP